MDRQPTIEHEESDSPDQHVNVVVETPQPEPAEPAPQPPAVAPILALPADAGAYEDRARSIESRLAVQEAGLIELRARVEGLAPAGHEHAVHPSLQALLEHLDEIESEEVMPERPKSILHRRLFR